MNIKITSILYIGMRYKMAYKKNDIVPIFTELTVRYK